jgi:hypothetical protein
MENTSSEFVDRQISRYFEASAANLVRDEFSNKPRNIQPQFGFDAASFWVLT